MADPNDPKPGAPREVHLGPPHKRANWLPWLLLALGLLALLLFLTRGCSRQDTANPAASANATAANAAGASAGAPAADNVAAPAAVAAAPAAYSAASFGQYLASTEPLPRSFALDKPNFDTNKADIRPEDEGTISELAGLLKQHRTAKVRLTGYADARGTEPVNQQLGQQRAEAIKNALVKAGINADRIETASGGDSNPVASNGTAQGQFENRRTEMTVTAR